MAKERLGKVKATSGSWTDYEFEVWWDPATKDVYVGTYGSDHAGKADNAAHAMRVGEAWVAVNKR